MTPSYDPEANLTYWGVGNPGPDWNGDVRMGDNLFSDSVVAIDPDTGKRKWHFQFTPHDVHDWDAVQVMVLVDREYKGKQRKLLITANRNGFFYVLDRVTGEFLHANPFVKQTWAKEIDEKGRPIRVPGKEPTEEGNHVYPAVAGGTNWMSPTYSPVTGLFYVTVREGGSMYYKGPADYNPGTRFWGGRFVNESVDDDWYGGVRALDPLTGEKVWEHRMFSPAWAGPALDRRRRHLRRHRRRLLQGARRQNGPAALVPQPRRPGPGQSHDLRHKGKSKSRHRLRQRPFRLRPPRVAGSRAADGSPRSSGPRHPYPFSGFFP